jgi:hypothetical protein
LRTRDLDLVLLGIGAAPSIDETGCAGVVLKGKGIAIAASGTGARSIRSTAGLRL